jgi:hypothetical protein
MSNTTPNKGLSLAERLKAAAVAKPEFEPLPEGDYVVRFEDVNQQKSQKGNEMLLVDFVVTEAANDELIGKRIRDWLLLEGPGLYKLAHILRYLDLNFDDFTHPGEIAKAILHEQIGVHVNPAVTQNGNPTHKVQYYFSLLGDAPNSAGATTTDTQPGGINLDPPRQEVSKKPETNKPVQSLMERLKAKGK